MEARHSYHWDNHAIHKDEHEHYWDRHSNSIFEESYCIISFSVCFPKLFDIHNPWEGLSNVSFITFLLKFVHMCNSSNTKGEINPLI